MFRGTRRAARPPSRAHLTDLGRTSSIVAWYWRMAASRADWPGYSRGVNRVLSLDLGESVPALVPGDVGVMVGTLWAACVVCRRPTCVDENNVGDEEWQRLTGWPSWQHRWWPVDRDEAARMIAADQVLC